MFKHKSVAPEVMTKKRGSDEIKKAELPDMKYKSQSNVEVLKNKVAPMDDKPTAKGKHDAPSVIIEESSMSSSFETESAMLD